MNQQNYFDENVNHKFLCNQDYTIFKKFLKDVQMNSKYRH